MLSITDPSQFLLAKNTALRSSPRSQPKQINTLFEGLAPRTIPGTNFVSSESSEETKATPDLRREILKYCEIAKDD